MSQSNRCRSRCLPSAMVKERAISYYSAPNEKKILRATVCDEHFHRMMEVDGPEWRWLKTLRQDLN